MKKTLLTILIICSFTTFNYSQVTIDFEDFNSGWGIWNDGGNDCFRLDENKPNTSIAIKIRDNSGVGSSMTTDDIDLTDYNSVDFTFDFEATSMENGEDFWVQYSDNGGTSWITIADYNSGTEFNNGTDYTVTVSISSDLYSFSTNSQFRIRCDASGDYDSIHIDNVLIEGWLRSGPEIDVKGLGNPISDGDMTPNTADDTNFGTISSGSSVDHTFTIENTGTTNLNLSGSPIVNISGHADFSVLTQPSSTSITPGNSLTFVIRYTPSVSGTFIASISIDNDDSNENPYNLDVQGTGVVPLTAGPGGVTSDLQLWFKANDGLSYTDGQSVNLWSNQGRGVDATTNLPAQAPTYRDNAAYNVNFNPVVDFDSDYSLSPLDGDYSYDNTRGDFLKGDDSFYTQDIFVVVIPDVAINSSFGNMDLFCGDEDLSTDSQDVTGVGYGRYSARFSNEVFTYCIGPTSSRAPFPGYGVADINSGINYDNVGIINTRNNSTANEQELYYNANNSRTIQNDVGDFSNVNNSRFWIGRSEAYEAATDARITEIITFTSRQDDVSYRPKIESYLAIKYGITLGVNGTSQDYIDSNGNVIWDVSANSGFNYDIAGIGLDNDSELNQKQSKSVNTGSLVAIGLGEVAVTNNLNSNNFLTDRDFLVWGNDNDSFNTSSEVSQNINLSSSTTTFTKVSRKWKIIESQNDVPEVVISIPTSVLTSNIPLAANEQYMLVVADDEGFASNSIIDVVPLAVNGSNSEVWYDFDGTKYFTFAKASRVEEKRRIDFASGEFLIGDNDLELSNSFTVSAWILNNLNGGSFISKGAGYNFKVNGSNRIEFEWNGSTQITSNNSIPTGEWHHIAIVYSGGLAKIYIDGVLDSSIGSLPNPIACNSRFVIGAYYTDKSNIASFDGAVDEVRFWNNALTIDEIRYIMNQEIEEFTTKVDGEILPQSITKNDISGRDWSDLQAYYDMNSFFGSTVEDNSSNKNWARIKYLIKDKQVVESQTAPLPYESKQIGSWDNSSTWLNNTVQYLPNTAIYGTNVDWNIVETNHNVNSIRNTSVLGLKINANELSINADNALFISHYLLLDGVLDLDGESQLIQTTDSDFDVASSGYLERDQQGEGSRFRYNDWSSPVILQGVGNSVSTPYTVADVLKDGTNPSSPGNITFVSGYDGAVGPPIQISDLWIYKYANSPEGDYNSWSQVKSNGNINAGEGFLMKGTGNSGASEQNYVFKGKPNNGDVNLTVYSNYDYLVGNPYPSTLDANKFINDNTSSITGTLYFWEHYGGNNHNLRDYQAGYGTYNLSGGVNASSHPRVCGLGSSTKLPTRYIAVSQGFFVVGDSDGGTITFNNSQRVFETEGSGNSVFLKMNVSGKQSQIKQNNNWDSRTKIRIGFDAPQIDHRQLLLTMDKNASIKVDWGYDAEIYEIFNDDMYWMIDEKKYVIQAIRKINKNKEIPIGIVTKEGGLITIKLDLLENIAKKNIKLFIKDKFTGETHNINKKPFNIYLDPGEYNDRFSLAFKNGKKDNEIKEKDSTTNSEINIRTSSEILEIRSVSNEFIRSIELYNMLGQQLKVWSNNINNQILNLNHGQSSGIYIVKMNSDYSSTSKKIIID